MTKNRTRIVAVGVMVAVLLPIVTLMLSARSAQAVHFLPGIVRPVDLPPPVRAPSSVLGSGGGSNREFNNIVRQIKRSDAAGRPSRISLRSTGGNQYTPGQAASKVPTGGQGTVVSKGTTGSGASKLGTVARGGGMAIAGVTGLAVGYEIGSATMTWLGWNDSSTGSFFCDMSMIFSGQPDCNIGAAPEYEPNFGIVEYAAGFSDAPVFYTGPYSQSNGRTWSAAVVTIIDVDMPEFGTNRAGGISIYYDRDGTCPENVTWWGGRAPVGVWTFGHNSNGSLASTGSSSNATGVNPSCPPGTIRVDHSLVNYETRTASHLEFRLQTYLDMVTDGPSTVYYYPPGHELRDQYPGSDGNPQRQWKVEAKCDVSGGAFAYTTSYSEPFHEIDPEWPGLPAADCESGMLVGLKAWQITEGLPDELIYEWDVPAEVPAFYETYPECADGSCELLISRNTSADTVPRYLSCFEAPELCVSWWEETQQGTSVDTDYECRLGEYTLSLDDCLVYRDLFSQNELKPNPVEDPEPSPSPGPAPGPAPDSGCPPSFSWLSLFNPWWYYKGVACALEWAFVPSMTTVQTLVQDTRADLEMKPPFNIIPMVHQVILGAFQGAEGGCSTMPDFTPGRGLLIPCEPQSSTAVATLRTVGAMIIVVAGAFGAWHMIAAQFGARATDGD